METCLRSLVIIYLSIDIETTGLNPETDQIIEIGAVLDNLKEHKPFNLLPKFHTYVKRERYSGQPAALAMHSKIFSKIAKNVEGYQYCWPNQVTDILGSFLLENIPVDKREKRDGKDDSYSLNVAGKNAGGFDLLFLGKLARKDMDANGSLSFGPFHVRKRCLDPAILYFDPETDTCLPSLTECLKRASIPVEVTHTAVEDAMCVVQLLRKYYHRKPDAS